MPQRGLNFENKLCHCQVLIRKVGLVFSLLFVVVLVCQLSFPLGRLLVRICFIISAISSGGPYRRCSALISSIPGLVIVFQFI